MRPAQFGVDLGWVVDPALGSIICGQIVASLSYAMART
jgi:hypothetical protein